MATTTQKRRGRPPKRPDDRLVDFPLRIERALVDDIQVIGDELALDRSKAARYLLSTAVSTYKQKRRPDPKVRAA